VLIVVASSLDSVGPQVSLARQIPCGHQHITASCHSSPSPFAHHSLDNRARSLALNLNILALSNRLRLGFFIVLFFVCTSAILASTRLGSRLTSLFSQIRPPTLFPAFTRPIITSTMAPKQYQKPPQAPPSFTATATSLVDDAKAICGTYLVSRSLSFWTGAVLGVNISNLSDSVRDSLKPFPIQVGLLYLHMDAHSK
jgi:hypothetical protein